MSIFTQVFLVNLIAWVSFALFMRMTGIDTDKIIDNEGVKGWSLVVWTLLTVGSIPAWLIYLVIS